MSFNISDFRANFAFGGARPSQFDVIITAPGSLVGVNIAANKLRFTCKAASIPTSELGEVQAFYFGRPTKYAGNRTFEDWTVTVMNDEDWIVRNALEQWNNAINAHEENVRHNGANATASSYKGVAIVRQYGKENEILQTYTLKGVWPKNVGEIELNWENANQIEEFQTIFTYDDWIRGADIV